MAKSDLVQSYFPVFGTNPTYGIFLGGGLFLEKENNFSFGTSLLITTKKVGKIESQFEFNLNPKWKLILYNEFGKGFEPNYGEGNSTNPGDRVDVPILKNTVILKGIYNMNEHLALGMLIDDRVRKSSDPIAPPTVERNPYLKREHDFALGLHQSLDFRDDHHAPSNGWHEEFEARIIPASWQAGPSTKTFAAVETHISNFQQLMHEDVVLATSLHAGDVFFSQAPYMYQYRLGGTDRLRGFLENRFRGNKFYAQQTELRFPIWKPFYGATFIEFGETTMERFTRPSLSYGTGIYLNLSSKSNKRVRLDFAFARDQKGIFLDFGYAF